MSTCQKQQDFTGNARCCFAVVLLELSSRAASRVGAAADPEHVLGIAGAAVTACYQMDWRQSVHSKARAGLSSEPLWSTPGGCTGCVVVV